VVMQKFIPYTARYAVLPIENIDTDQIIPARFLKTTDKTGLGESLFSDWRYEGDGTPKADFLLNIGGRFDDRVTGKASTFAPNATIVHVDIDPSEIGKNIEVDVPIVGDAKLVLLSMLEEEPEDAQVASFHAAAGEWLTHIRELQSKHQHRQQYLNRPDTSSMLPHDVYAAMTKMLNERGNYRVVTDVGQHQMFAAQFYKFDRPRRWINSGGLGTMGFGLPAAIGAQLANPESTVVCVTGESSIQMCLQELSTCKQYHLPIKILCLNNRYMGMVRQWQEFFHGNRYSESYMDALPDFVKLAESYGHVGMRIERPGDIEGALREAFSRRNDLVFMDFITDQTENVFPMVPGGKGLSEMILV